ncbi:hypothetical protein BJ138DRAFT_1114570 [Hygrophoropsis aurantiaca]|uniref:Uncharacterized protein n=1 Tax=Hygrophoropsis aurantiaca TaxID=72124 RepID=A0ACB8A9D4_9AGAM|nr:hypothetical protein BJ138DRAFT_1114570 [Hygrophoropsis aurantiaca]
MNSTLPPGFTLEPIIDVSVLIGPVELGVVVAIFLFGCSIVQGYIYYSTFRKDPWFFKVLVASVLAVETAHVMSVTACMWSMTVATYGNPVALTVFPTGADLAILFTSLISAIVQGFYVFRLTRFSKTRILPAFCAAVSASAHITSLVIAGKAFAMKSLAQFESANFRLITLCLASDVVCDLALTCGMVYHLRNRRKSGFPQTVYAIDRLILWTLGESCIAPAISRNEINPRIPETGLITCLNSILVLVFFLTMKQNFVWVGLYAFFACIYTNSLLASLNSRLNVLSKHSEESYGLSSRSNASRPRIPPVVIDISRTVERSVGDKSDIQASIVLLSLQYISD